MFYILSNVRKWVIFLTALRQSEIKQGDRLGRRRQNYRHGARKMSYFYTSVKRLDRICLWHEN